MTATLFPNGKQYYSLPTGVPNVGGKLYTYAAGTSTPQVTWTDPAQTVPNTNPVILDARGEALIFWNGNYKVVLKDLNDNTIWTVDNVRAIDFSASSGSSLVGFIQAGTGAVARTMQDKAREIVSVTDYGAIGNGVTDDTAAFQAASDWLMANGGGTIYVPSGRYKITSPINFSKAADPARACVSISGEGRDSTTIYYTGSGVLFNFLGHETVADGQYSYSFVEDLYLLGTGAASTTAINLVVGSFMEFRRLHIEAFDYAFYGQDVDHSLFTMVTARWNRHAFFARPNPTPVANSTNPNQLTFVECHFGSNFFNAVELIRPSNCAWIGGSVENNGKSDPVNGFGIKLTDGGWQGGPVCIFNGTYFETNSGVADLVLVNTTATVPIVSRATYVLNGCNFNRASPIYYATNCVATNWTAFVGEQALVMTGCTFKSFNGYVPSGARPYIGFLGVPRNKYNFVTVGCIFQDTVEAPARVQLINKSFLEAAKSANLSVANGVLTNWDIDTTVNGLDWGSAITGGAVSIPEDGFYSFSLNLVFAAAAPVTAYIKRNGTTIAKVSSASTDVLTVTRAKSMTAGDLITVDVMQTSGGALSLGGASTADSALAINKLID